MSLVIEAALYRYRQGKWMSQAQWLIVAYHPQGTAGGCPSAAHAASSG